MKVVLAADGSSFTKKALAFLTAQGIVDGAGDELVVINVQPPVPPRVKALAGAGAVREWHHDEARKVLEPIGKFLQRHKIPFRSKYVVGHAPDEIVRAAETEKASMIVMGTHGHGWVGRALMGSVAQKVVQAAGVPVLLAK
jgi:nucleotide-binding universal stress UspA family protein